MQTRGYKQRESVVPGLSLTAIPVVFDGDEIQGGTLPYEDEEQLAKLRADHDESHVFHRAGDAVLAIPVDQSADGLGEPARLSVEGDRLAVRLVRESLIRYFETLPYRMRRRVPIELVVTSRDLVPELVDPSQGNVQGVSIHPSYEVHVRMLYPRGRDPVCVVAVDSRVRAAISLTAKDLLDQGMDLLGKYVVSPDDGRLIGRVASSDGDELLLEDYRDSDKVKASECRLESRVENLIQCLAHLCGVDLGTLRARLDRAGFRITGAEGKKEAVERLHGHLKSATLTAANGVTFQFGDVLRLGNDTGLIPTRFSLPTFVFDPTGNKSHHWHDDGLNLYGPFDAEFFSKKDPRVSVVTPGDYQGEVEVFLRRLKDGIGNSKRFDKGLVRKYHLNGCRFDLFPFDEGTNSPHAYREACLNAMDSGPFDLALVVTREEFHNLHGEENPYLVTKAALMSQGVPVQEIEVETLRERGIQYILNNVALACYAKLGGIPYTIAAPTLLAHELVIGLGSVQLQEERLSERSRVVGITTVFNTDGTYLLTNVAREVRYGRYVEELKASLASCVEEVSTRNAWQSNDKLRLVFHVFKPLKDSEAQAVKAFVESLTDYDVEFAFLTLSQEHPFTMLDRDQKGVRDYESKMTKGKLVPPRGWAVRIGGRELLMALTGPAQIRTPYQGAPHPVLLRLHRESTFGDLNYLAQQAYNFTFLSWRSFSPASLPVTVSYSRLIGRLLGQLGGLQNWNPDMLRTRLRTSRWFL